MAGDYSIVLKDFIEQTIPGCPFNLPVYNPSVVHLEPFNRLQPINDFHLICTYPIFKNYALIILSLQVTSIEQVQGASLLWFILKWMTIPFNQS